MPCPRCGYDLTNVNGLTCPNCGLQLAQQPAYPPTGYPGAPSAPQYTPPTFQQLSSDQPPMGTPPTGYPPSYGSTPTPGYPQNPTNPGYAAPPSTPFGPGGGYPQSYYGQ